MARTGPADTVLLGGRIHTVDARDRTVEAMAVRDGRVQAVGEEAEIRALAAEHTEVVDLAGKAVVPGITDCHTHFEQAAVAHHFFVSVHSPPCTDFAALFDTLRAACDEKEPGEWVMGQGNLLHDQRLAERRFPTREDLDRVSTEHPIFLKLSAHVSCFNTAALERLDIGPDFVVPGHGEIDRDAGGNATGVMREVAKRLPLPTFDLEQRREALVASEAHYFLRHGVTCLGDMPPSRASMGMMQDLKASGDLSLRLALYLFVPEPFTVDQIVGAGLSSGFGSDHLSVAGVKTLLDGGVTARKAATYEPYRGTNTRGGLQWTRQELDHLVRSCNEADLQVMIHASADRSMDFALDSYEAELRRCPRPDHRWRIEHVSYPFLTDEIVRRMAALEVIGVPQPPHFYAMGDFWEDLIGPQVPRLALRLRTMVDLGMRPPGSSDLTGSQPESSNPFLGMWTAVNRRAVFGTQYPMDEAVTAREALRMYTIDSAHAVRQDHVRGSLEPGKLADLAILDRDPLAIPPEELIEVEVRETWIDGRRVYQASGGG